VFTLYQYLNSLHYNVFNTCTRLTELRQSQDHHVVKQ